MQETFSEASHLSRAPFLDLSPPSVSVMQGLITRHVHAASLVLSMPVPVVTASLASHFTRSGGIRRVLRRGQLCLDSFLAPEHADLTPLLSPIALGPYPYRTLLAGARRQMHTGALCPA